MRCGAAAALSLAAAALPARAERGGPARGPAAAFGSPPHFMPQLQGAGGARRLPLPPGVAGGGEGVKAGETAGA
eukprot:gene1206-13349_t